MYVKKLDSLFNNNHAPQIANTTIKLSPRIVRYPYLLL